MITRTEITGIESNYAIKNVKLEVRAIVEFINGIMIVNRTERGCYRLPGGRAKTFETGEEAITRIVQEQTGYKDIGVIEKIGRFVKAYPSEYSPIEWQSDELEFYHCEINSYSQNPVILNDYDKSIGIITTQAAPVNFLAENKDFIALGNPDNYDWLEKDTNFLEEYVATLPQKDELFFKMPPGKNVIRR